MKRHDGHASVSRRAVLSALAAMPALPMILPAPAPAQPATPGGGLASWNEGPKKQAILDFVRATTDRSSASYVAPEDRIATFDQDGTLWVEQPMYTQVIYCFDRVPVLAEKRPELKRVEPFKTGLSDTRGARARLWLRDLKKVLSAAVPGVWVDDYNPEAKKGREAPGPPR